MTAMVSLFPHIRATTDGAPVALADVLASIKEGRWQREVEAVRAEPYGSQAYDQAKRALPYFTPSGTFERRAISGLTCHSGFMSIDLDAKQNPEANWSLVRVSIQADPHTYACFTSTGGQGLCVIVPVPTTHHGLSFRALEAYYLEQFAVKVDSLPDVSRARFVSYDPALYLNAEAETFAEILEEPAQKVPPRAQPQAEPDLRSADTQSILIAIGVKMIREAADGNKHVAVRNAAFTVGGYVGSGFVSEGRAFDELYAAILAKENVADPKNAEAAIRSGLTKGAQKPLWPDFLQAPLRKELRDGKQSFGTVVAQAQEWAAKLHIPAEQLQPAIQAVADELNDQRPILTFWDILETPGTKRDAPSKFRLQLNYDRFGEWLSSRGFCKHSSAATGIVRVLDNVVHPVEVTDLIEHVKAYTATLPWEVDGFPRDHLKERIKREHRSLFDPQGLLFLDPLRGEFVRDTATTHYTFFQNCWFEVTATGRRARPYSELHALVYASTIKPLEVAWCTDESAQLCPFYTFTQRVSGDEAQKLSQLQRGLGYLIHGYKDVTNARCVIFMDAVGEVGKSGGGTGKGLLMQAVGEVVEVVLLDGSNFDLRDAFRYEEVTDTARVVFFDEWRATRNPFEALFSTLTGPLPINRKYQAKKSLPFKDAPKFAIATNEVVTGDDDSNARRRVEIALAKHYSAIFTPKDDFGKGFFGEHWDSLEYNRFYNLAMLWVQDYLANGLLLLKDERITARGLAQDVGVTFHEFATELRQQAQAEREQPLAQGELPRLLWLADTFEAYQKQTGDKRLTSVLFSKKMVQYGFVKVKNSARAYGDTRRGQYYFTLPDEPAPTLL